MSERKTNGRRERLLTFIISTQRPSIATGTNHKGIICEAVVVSLDWLAGSRDCFQRLYIVHLTSYYDVSPADYSPSYILL